jgi:hypothetical protein
VLFCTPVAHANTNHDHVHSVDGVKRLLERVWHPSRWERGDDPRTDSQRRRIRHFRRSNEARPPRLREIASRERGEYRRHRERKLEAREARQVSSLTPYDCGSAGSFAIPCYIVACESGYSWSAYNPSGAAGPYQIMPEHGRPYPIDSAEDRLAHHRIASSLWNGGAGASNWVCA